MDESTEKQDNKSSVLATLAGSFAVFTIGYAIFNFTTDSMGMHFDKKSTLFRSLFVGSYLLVNVISWPILRKYLK